MSLHYRGWDVTCETCVNPLSSFDADPVRTKTELRKKAKRMGWTVQKDWKAKCHECKAVDRG